jgi:tetratricopeptide (TPR) repeat protein
MSPQPRYRKGDRIGGRYLVHQALLGGMGEVYLCLDLREIVPIALKTFQARYLTNPRIRELFAHEIGTWVALEKHPNIVHCFYMQSLDNQPFMLLEWVAGEAGKGNDLRSWLCRGPLDLRAALDITIDICRGLIHAQTKQPGIVHRDLKPDNVLVSHRRLAKITDFGLASLVQQAGLELAAHNETRSGRQTLIGARGVVGTPPYMAPEQWRGEPGDVRIDIYAVGCILYELLTGTLPYPATTLEGFQQLHTTAALPIIPATERLPESLNSLLARCLAKVPDERFADATELLDALNQLYRVQFGVDPRVMPAIGTFTSADNNNRGATYHTLGRYNEALIDLDRAITLDPTFALAYNNRGNVFAELGRYNKALADFDRAITLDPTYAQAYNNRGNVFAELGRYNEALADFDRAITLDPTIAQAYSNRSTTFSELGRSAEAVADLDRAITLDPTYAQAYFNRGNAFAELSRYEDALADYTRAIEHDATYAQAYNNRGTTLGKLDRYSEAITDFDRAISLDPIAVQGYVNRGFVYQASGRYDEALADYDHAITLDPTIVQAYTSRGKIFSKLGRYNEALADLDRAIQLGASDAQAYFDRGSTYDDLNRYDEALADFDRAIQLDLSDAKVYGNRAITYAKLGRYNEALADFDRVISLDPTAAQGYVNRGLAYQALGRYDEALTDYDRAITFDPTYGPGYHNVGALLVKRGKLREALPYFEQAAQLGDPQGREYAARVRRILRIEPTENINPAQQAFEAFQRAASLTEMQQAVGQYPIMTDRQFIAAVEQTIAEQVRREHRLAFEQRLSWLREIAGEQR